MVQLEISPSEWKNYIGKELGTSDWYEVTQDEINEYGRIVGDMQWIHTEPERARKESPYGTTVAHGNWVLSIAFSKLFSHRLFEILFSGFAFIILRCVFLLFLSIPATQK